MLPSTHQFYEISIEECWGGVWLAQEVISVRLAVYIIPPGEPATWIQLRQAKRPILDQWSAKFHVARVVCQPPAKLPSCS